MTIPVRLSPSPTLTALDDQECQALLGTTTVGHLAFVDAEGQQLIPLNFAFIDGFVYARTSHESILAGLARGHEDVAFGIEHQDVFRSGWNVTVRGSVDEVEDRATINVVLSHHRLDPWAGGVRPLVLRITPRSFAGRRVHGGASH
ncbi:pyridoxamine 5'-phosphate oxidase family protein [Aeromicrobium sp. NPDC092404]|uniref:pyridoxamine 5'-phosphate oxidase family protein n=1 Tax=Aeromicrobium sp. NPDC092404 TaxID=3154976 RepID=UPI0034320F7C